LKQVIVMEGAGKLNKYVCPPEVRAVALVVFPYVVALMLVVDGAV
jgi:hypothetical protein